MILLQEDSQQLTNSMVGKRNQIMLLSLQNSITPQVRGNHNVPLECSMKWDYPDGNLTMAPSPLAPCSLLLLSTL